MNLEARPIVFEDMVRQILSCGYRKRPEELLQEIGRFFIQSIKLHKQGCPHKISSEGAKHRSHFFIRNSLVFCQCFTSLNCGS